MKTTIKLTIVIVSLLVATSLEARQTRMLSYAKLLAKSDIVVIAKPISNTDTKDTLNSEPRAYIGIDTKLEVLEILKGDAGIKHITVLHFKDNPAASVEDGLGEVIFRLKTLHINAENLKFTGILSGIKLHTIGLLAPDYLLWL